MAKKQLLRGQLHEADIGLHPDSHGPREVKPELQRALAWLMVRSGQELSLVRGDNFGNLFVRPPDKGIATRYHLDSSIAASSSLTVDFGFAADFWEVRGRTGYLWCDVAIDGTNVDWRCVPHNWISAADVVYAEWAKTRYLILENTHGANICYIELTAYKWTK
tara:strand:+ start:1944 stop:2432 length:489 start_codon:yes stop_codon:yes gene_type:complete